MEQFSLVPIYFDSRREFLEPLMQFISETFYSEVRVRLPWFDPEDAFDASRGQYHSTMLLEFLLDEPAATSSRILGVTGSDLFVPVLTYVFGEAQLQGTAAVVSCLRLQDEMYGLPRDDAKTLQRLQKETVHELGHTYGLLHCDDACCVMRASTYVEEIDLKSGTFCPSCGALLPAASGTPNS